MPRVPSYEPNVALRPAFRQDVDVRATPEAFGADIGRGMQGLARGVGRFSDEMAKLQALEDETAVREARNAYMTERDVLMYDPDTGYMHTTGKNALDQRKAFEDNMRVLREKYAKDLNPRRKQMFAEAIDTLEIDAHKSMMLHAGSQLKQHVVDQGNSAVANFQNEALRHAGNDAMSDKYMAAAINEMKDLAAKQGWSAEEIDRKQREFISDTTQKTALQIAGSDPIAADKYIEKHGDRLTPEHRLALKEKLKNPINSAKAQRNLNGLLTGMPKLEEPDATLPKPEKGAAEPGSPVETFSRRPQQSVNDVVRGLMGKHEGTDAAAISEFIKRSAGITIDPRRTAWCAAFANAVLGAQGIKGTGKLNARSFLSFGMPTDKPQIGDVVVLSRGDPNGSQGHVGFFQGFDENGNIMVLGGNQGDRVSVATYGRDRLLGFRTAGNVDANTARLPNYNPQGLGHIYAQVSKIKDPDERAATLKAVNTYFETQKKAIDANRDMAEQQVAQMIFADPSIDLMRLPPDMQDALGASGMTTAMTLQEKIRSHGEPHTDQETLAELSDAFAIDPDNFATRDLFQYRDRLSKADFDKVLGWKRTAQTDKRKAREEGLNLSAAFSFADAQLEAVGITTTGKKGSEREGAAQRIALFRNALTEEMETFKQQNDGKAPTQADIQTMTNKLLLPIVIKTPGLLWGFNSRDAFLFEAGMRPDRSMVDVEVQYESIPIDLRRAIAADLETQRGRKPSEEEIVQRYEDAALNRWVGGDWAYE